MEEDCYSSGNSLKNKTMEFGNFDSHIKLSHNLTQNVATVDVKDNQPLTNGKANPNLLPYDPHDHRFIKQPLTYTDALSHMIKGAIGTGILTIPHAFKDAGYLLGFVGTICISTFMTYNVHRMIEAQYEICCRLRLPSLSYPNILGAAFKAGPPRLRWLAPYGRFLSLTALALTEVGSMCIYVVFIAQNLNQMCSSFSLSKDLRLYMLSIFPIFLVISFIPSLKRLAILSSGSVVILFACFTITLYKMLQDIPPLRMRKAVGLMEDFPLFFCTVLFSCSYMGVIMPIENEMRHPKQLSSKLGVMNMATVINTIVYVSFGMLGYLKYGEETQGSIVLNLPAEDNLTLLVQLLLSLAILLTFPLTQFVFHDILWNHCLKLRLPTTACPGGEHVTRAFGVVLVVTLAIIVPNLELFVSLIGGLCLGLTSLIIPAMADLLTFYNRPNRFGIICCNVITILIGIIGSCAGVYFSIKDIVQVYQGQHVEV